MRWTKLFGELKRLTKRDAKASLEELQSVWFLWATYVLEDMPHIQRVVGFAAPEEAGSWESLRELSNKRRKPRSRLKPPELALLIDIGDWLMEQRRVESENAGNLVSLLNASSIFAHAHGDPQCSEVRSIYRHIADVFGVMPPPLVELPASQGIGWTLIDRNRVMAMCDRLMRESELVPDWYFDGGPMPAGAKQSQAETASGGDVEQVEPPTTGDLFDD